MLLPLPLSSKCCILVGAPSDTPCQATVGAVQILKGLSLPANVFSLFKGTGHPLEWVISVTEKTLCHTLSVDILYQLVVFQLVCSMYHRQQK